MRTYRIIIEEAMDGDSKDWRTAARVVCDSSFRLDVDILEWISQEVDQSAEVEFVPDDERCCTQITLTPGGHSTRCENYVDPNRQAVIEPSFTCERCGSVFAASDYHAYAEHINEPHSSDSELGVPLDANGMQIENGAV